MFNALVDLVSGKRSFKTSTLFDYIYDVTLLLRWVRKRSLNTKPTTTLQLEYLPTGTHACVQDKRKSETGKDQNTEKSEERRHTPSTGRPTYGYARVLQNMERAKLETNEIQNDQKSVEGKRMACIGGMQNDQGSRRGNADFLRY